LAGTVSSRNFDWANDDSDSDVVVSKRTPSKPEKKVPTTVDLTSSADVPGNSGDGVNGNGNGGNDVLQ